MPKILFFINEDWAFLLQWRRLAEACRAAGWEVVIATHVTDRAQEIVDAGFVLEPLPFERRGVNPLKEVRTLLALAAILRRHRPDLMHCIAVKPVLYGALVAGLAVRCPVIGTFSGLGYVFTGRGLAVRLLAAVVAPALRVALGLAAVDLIVQNDDDRLEVARLGLVDPRRVTVIPGGVGVDLDAFPALPPPKTTPIIFALVARMLADKGVVEAVDAIGLARSRGADCRLWLVGGPDPQNPTAISEDTLRRWQRDGAAEWLGHRADIVAIWRQAHVALLPSYREGMPTALMEAASCGRPILTTDVPGCRAVIEDGVEGLLVPARDAAALADAIVRLVAEEPVRLSMGRAARRRAERWFDHRRVSEAHLAVYRKKLAAIDQADGA
jgi:glycosyltransferase involved in cell wall biosynthesis